MRRLTGRAVADFSMLHDGDRVLIGLSGGKDSLLLTCALADLLRRSPVKFSLSACTVTMTENVNTTDIENFCASLDISFKKIFHPILSIIETRDERSPCSFCANMRRGLLSGYASDNGFNLLALGHNLDDAVETAYMNLFRAGRFKSFQPKLFQDRTNLWIIRPLVYLRETKIIADVERLALPVLKNPCPFAGETERQRIKKFLHETSQKIPDIYANTLNALKNINGDDAWKIL